MDDVVRRQLSMGEEKHKIEELTREGLRRYNAERENVNRLCELYGIETLIRDGAYAVARAKEWGVVDFVTHELDFENTCYNPDVNNRPSYYSYRSGHYYKQFNVAFSQTGHSNGLKVYRAGPKQDQDKLQFTTVLDTHYSCWYLDEWGFDFDFTSFYLYRNHLQESFKENLVRSLIKTKFWVHIETPPETPPERHGDLGWSEHGG